MFHKKWHLITSFPTHFQALQAKSLWSSGLPSTCKCKAHTHTHINTGVTQGLFLSFIMSPVREENEFCIVMLHLPLLISYSRAVDGWYLPWSCGDFQYPEVQNSGREPSSQNDNVYSKKKKRQNCCLENRNVSLMRKHLASATLRKRTFEAIDSEKLCLLTGNYFPKDTSVWLWGNGGTKRNREFFISSGIHMLLT